MRKVQNFQNKRTNNFQSPQKQAEEKTQRPPAKFTYPQAVPDILPYDHEYQTYIKKVIRHRCRQSGFRRITVPMFERAEIFDLAYGQSSELARQLYRFTDPEGVELALKPDSTVGICRSYIENEMYDMAQPVELYYIDPHFRFEKNTGKGTYRQFWQFGFEVLGERDSALDAQLIQMAQKIFTDLGVNDLLGLKINNLGNKDSREKYKQALRDYFFGKERYMSEEAKQDLEINPIRLLNYQDEDMKILAELAPTIDLYLDKQSKEDFALFQEYLTELGVTFEVDRTLVRGADFYTGNVFEIHEISAEHEKHIGGGGHFDYLIEDLGGEPTPGIGFAVGMERVISLMKREKIRVPSKDDLHVFVAQLSSESKKKCLNLIAALRENGVKTVGAMGKGAIRHQLTIAEKFKVPYTLLLGLTEVRDGTIIIRNMKNGTQETVPFSEAVERVIKKLGKSKLDTYSPGEVLY
jgi:histidyl-tRNA synthetase